MAEARTMELRFEFQTANQSLRAKRRTNPSHRAKEGRIGFVASLIGNDGMTKLPRSRRRFRDELLLKLTVHY